MHRHRLRRDHHGPAAGSSEHRLEVVDVLANEVAELEARDVAGASGAREREELFDDREESRALFERGFGLFTNFRRVVAGELLDAQLQAGERGPELVARVRREAALGAQQLLHRVALRSRDDAIASISGTPLRGVDSEKSPSPSRVADRASRASGSARRRLWISASPSAAPSAAVPSTTSARSACCTRVSMVSDGDWIRTNE